MKASAITGPFRREMGTLLVGRVLIGIAGFASVRLLTTVMSPELYGSYALVLGYMGLTAGLFINPLAQTMNRFVHDAAQAGKMRSFLARGLAATTAMALIGALGLPIFLAFYLRDEPQRGLMAGLIVLAILGANLRDRQFGMFNTFRWRRRYVTLAAADAWMKTISIALAIMWVGASLLSTLIGMAMGTWLLALAGLPWLLQLSRYRPPSSSEPRPFETRALTRYALPLFGVNLLAWLVATSDRYVIAGILGEAELGRYVASAQVAQAAPGLLASIFFPMFTPILFQRMATHPNEPLHLDRYALGITTVTLFFGGLLLADVGSAFSILVSREDFHTGDSVVPFVLLAQLCYMLHQVAEHEAYFQKRTGRLIFANGAGAIVSLGLNLLLVSKVGVMGAAIGALATYATLLAGTVLLYKPSITKATWARIALLTLGAALAIVATRLVIPNDWPGFARAPSRWLLFGLMFSAGALVTVGHRLRASREQTQVAS